MRLWSLHPRYLDAKGLVALWREALLAQKVLQGETTGYRHHPQLTRFRACRNPVAALASYLQHVYNESLNRNYHFDNTKILRARIRKPLLVSEGQLQYERQHLLNKLRERDPSRYEVVAGISDIQPHPLFRVVPGDIEDWEIQ